MVKVVDHDKRREEMAEVAAKIIAKDGLEALTTRRLAKDVGCSLGIVSYYFTNKYEMVIAALNWSDQGVFKRLSKFDQTNEYNIDQFKAVLQLFLPLKRQSDIEWRVRLNLITYSVTDKKLRESQRQQINFAYDYAHNYIVKLNEAGGIQPGYDLEVLAKNTVDMVFGLASYLVMIPMKDREERSKDFYVYIDSVTRTKNKKKK